MKKLEETEDLSESKEDEAEELQPRILTMISDKNKPTEEEVRLTELASRILEDAMKQPEENKAEKSFLKLQNIVNQVVS